MPPRWRGMGDGCGTGDPDRPGRPGGAAAARAAGAGPADGDADAGHRQRARGQEPGGGGAARRHGAPGVARRRGALQRRRARGPARPPEAGPPARPERRGAGLAAGGDLPWARPGARRLRRLDAAGALPMDRAPLRQAAAPGEPVTDRAKARSVPTEDPAAASGGGRAGQGGLHRGGLRAAVEAVAEAHPDKRVELWFEDEARVGPKGRTGHRWWVRGERPRGLRQQGYEWAHQFGAIRPATGEGFALVLPEVSTAATQAFLDRFAAGLAADTHTVLVLDQAGWHGSRSLAVPPDITLVPLPPYAPELNPVERVWLFLRERFLSHRVLDGYDAILEACCEARNALTPERLRSLCAYPWITKVAS